VHNKQNLPLSDDAVLGGNSPPPLFAVVLGGMQGVKWRLKNNKDRVKIAALRDSLKYGDRGKKLLSNLAQTETGLLLWTAYYLLWQVDNKNLSDFSKVTLPFLVRQKMQKRLSNGEFIDAIAFTDKLTLLLTSAGASLTDINSDRLLWQIDCPTECAAVSRDRTMLALSWKHRIYLWNLRALELARQIEVGRGWVCNLVFSPDNKLITANVGSDRLINIWNVQSGDLVKQLQGHTASVKSLAFSPDNKLLASGGWNDIIRFWNIDSEKQIKRLEEEDSGRRLGKSLAFSPDGQFLAAACDRYFTGNDAIRLWDVVSGNPKQLLQGHQQPIVNLSFSNDGKLLKSESKDKMAYWWDLVSGDRSINNVETQNHFEKLNDLNSIKNLALSPDNKILATSGDDDRVCLWNLESDKPFKIFKGHQGAIERLTFSTDSKLLATASKDKTAILWNVESGQLLKTFIGHLDGVSSIVISPDGKLLATGSWDKTVKLWDMTSGWQQKTWFEHKGCVRSVVFSPDGTLLATGSSDCKIHLWQIASGKKIRTIRAYRDVLNLTFSPDGTTIASGGWDYFGSGSTLRLWDVASGKQLPWLENYTKTVHSLAFSPDGKLLATGGGDMTIRLWDMVTGKQVQMIEGHTRSVTSITFGKDSSLLVSGSSDRTVRFWNL
jgi:WD40 repeat protein